MPPLTECRQPCILVTGSHGLIGHALVDELTRSGFAVRSLDLRAIGIAHGDVRDPACLRRVMGERCTGVVHLAAVSRVIDGEKDPEACWETNVEGTRCVLEAALVMEQPPWVIYASSREVYGQPLTLPASEDAPLVPVNIYGRSKIAAEALVTEAPLSSAIVRFSNVYGSTKDHADRVVPAFARQALEGLALRVDGSDHTFDFTHLDDTVRGVMAVIAKLQEGVRLPPIQFVTGQPTTLGQLASLAVELAGSRSTIYEAPARSFDVSTFFGDPGRAKSLLDWHPRVQLRDGLARLMDDFRATAAWAVKS